MFFMEVLNSYCKMYFVFVDIMLFSHSVMSDSSRPHGLQHARLSCPSLPRVCSNACPLSQWRHPTISSSLVPFSSCFQSSPASGSFPMIWLFASGGHYRWFFSSLNLHFLVGILWRFFFCFSFGYHLVRKFPWVENPTMGFPGGSDGKESAHNVGDLSLIPGLERSPGEGNGNPLQYSCLENPMDRGAWGSTVCRVLKSQTWLRDFTFTFPFIKKNSWSKLTTFRILDLEVKFHCVILVVASGL